MLLSPAMLQLTPKPAVKEKYFLLFAFFFLGAHVLGLFVNLASELFSLNFGNNTYLPSFYRLLTMVIAHVLGSYLNLLVCTYLCL